MARSFGLCDAASYALSREDKWFQNVSDVGNIFDRSRCRCHGTRITNFRTPQTGNPGGGDGTAPVAADDPCVAGYCMPHAIRDRLFGFQRAWEHPVTFWISIAVPVAIALAGIALALLHRMGCCLSDSTSGLRPGMRAMPARSGTARYKCTNKQGND